MQKNEKIMSIIWNKHKFTHTHKHTHTHTHTYERPRVMHHSGINEDPKCLVKCLTLFIILMLKCNAARHAKIKGIFMGVLNLLNNALQHN